MSRAATGAVAVAQLQDLAAKALATALPFQASRRCSHISCERELRIGVRRLSCVPIPPAKRSRHHSQASFGIKQQEPIGKDVTLQDNSSRSSCSADVQPIKHEWVDPADDKLPSSTDVTATRFAGTATVAAGQQPSSPCASNTAAAACPASSHRTADPAADQPIVCCRTQPTDNSGSSGSQARIDSTMQADAGAALASPAPDEESSLQCSVPNSMTSCRGVLCAVQNSTVSLMNCGGGQHTGTDNSWSKVEGKHEAADKGLHDTNTYSEKLLARAAAARETLHDPQNNLQLYLQLLRPCMGEPLVYILLAALITREGFGGRKRQEHPAVDGCSTMEKQIARVMKNRDAAARSKLKEKIKKKLPAMQQLMQELRIKASKANELSSSTLHQQLFELLQHYPVHSKNNSIYIPQLPTNEQQLLGNSTVAVQTEPAKPVSACKQQQQKMNAQDGCTAASTALGVEDCQLSKRRATAAEKAMVAKFKRVDAAVIPAKANTALTQTATAVAPWSSKIAASAPVGKPGREKRDQMLLGRGGEGRRCRAVAAAKATALREAAAAALGEAFRAKKRVVLLIPKAKDESETVHSLLLLANVRAKSDSAAPQGLLSAAGEPHYPVAPPQLQLSGPTLQPAKLQAQVQSSSVTKPEAPAQPSAHQELRKLNPLHRTSSSGNAAGYRIAGYTTPGSGETDLFLVTAGGSSCCTTAACLDTSARKSAAEVTSSRPEAAAGADADAGVASTVVSCKDMSEVVDDSSAAAMPVVQQQQQQQQRLGDVAKINGNSRGVWQMMPWLECAERLKHVDKEVDALGQHRQQQQQQQSCGVSRTMFTVISRSCSSSSSKYAAAAVAAVEGGQHTAAAAAFLMADSAGAAMRYYAPEVATGAAYEPAGATYQQPGTAGDVAPNASCTLYTAQQPFVRRPFVNSSESHVETTVLGGTREAMDSPVYTAEQPFVGPASFASSCTAAGVVPQLACDGPRYDVTPAAGVPAGWGSAAAGPTDVAANISSECHRPAAAESGCSWLSAANTTVPVGLLHNTCYAMMTKTAAAWMGLAADVPQCNACFNRTGSSNSGHIWAAGGTAAAAAAAAFDDAMLAASVAADMEMEDLAAASSSSAAAQMDSSSTCSPSKLCAEVLCEYDNDGDRLMFLCPALGGLGDCKDVSGRGAVLMDPLQLYGL